MLKQRHRLLLMICFFSLMILLGGCDNENKPKPQITTPASNTPVVSGNVVKDTPPVSYPVETLHLYYPDKGANYLVAEDKKVDAANLGKNPPKVALEMLISGTSNPNLSNVIPTGTKLKSLKVKDGTAYANFNAQILKSGGGSTTEIFLVSSIVNTLTEFPNIDEVQILVDGKKVDTLAGHVDVSKPLGRSENIIKK